MAKMIRSKFSEKCKTFFRFKGVIQPRCGCGSCWSHYFFKNPAKVAAAALALKQFGEDAVILGQGKEYGEEQFAQQEFESKIGARRGTTSLEVLVRARGNKYLKHLKQWLRDNPIDSAEVAA